MQTQVIPYLREIAKGGVVVHLLTFERQPDVFWPIEAQREEKENLAKSGIFWHFLTYHKRFSIAATVYDVLNGVLFVTRLSRKTGIDILHARAHVPLAIALLARVFLRVRVIFDIRGLMAEEYVDAEIWREGSIPFRIIKWIEHWGLKQADGIVVLTERFRSYLIGQGLCEADAITVIPCCVDNSHNDNEKVAKSENFELVYAGSVTGLYLLREMVEFFRIIKEVRPNAFFRVLTAGDSAYVRKVFSEFGIDEADYTVEQVSPGDVLFRVKSSHAAISFRKPTFSQIAASPTKIGEYLSCGVPVIVNSGIGDADNQVMSDGTGVIVDSFSRNDYLKAVRDLLEMMENEALAEKCRQSAEKRFDLLGVGGPAYRRLYEKLLEND